MYNPRWPHILSAYRESLDSDGIPVTDDEGNIVREQIGIEKVVMDSAGNPVIGPDGRPKTETVLELPFGYRTSTGGIRASGDMFSTDFKISCPMILTPLEEGVVLQCRDYTHTFSVVVEKCTTYNWGTNIWYKDPGNNAELAEE